MRKCSPLLNASTSGRTWPIRPSRFALCKDSQDTDDRHSSGCSCRAAINFIDKQHRAQFNRENDRLGLAEVLSGCVLCDTMLIVRRTHFGGKDLNLRPLGYEAKI